MEASTIIFILILISFIFMFAGIYWQNAKIKKQNATLEKPADNKEEKIIEQINQLSKQLIEIKTKQDGQNTNLAKDLERLSGNLKTDLDKLKETTSTMTNEQGESKNKITKIMDKITEINQNVEKNQTGNQDLGKQISTLNNIFISNHKRGKMGEVSLNFILESILGENSNVFDREHVMTNNKRVDVLIKIKNNNIPIDSKFPLANFSALLETEKDSLSYKNTLKLLKTDIQKHITKIADSYIIKKDHTYYAVMYLPSQPIFDLIFSLKEMKSIFEMAHKKKVMILSPNTIPVALWIVNDFLLKMRLNANTTIAFNLLKEMEEEFKRFSERWDKLDRRISGLYEDKREFGITTKKIESKFEKIAQVKIEEKAPKINQETTPEEENQTEEERPDQEEANLLN